MQILHKVLLKSGSSEQTWNSIKAGRHKAFMAKPLAISRDLRWENAGNMEMIWDSVGFEGDIYIYV